MNKRRKSWEKVYDGIRIIRNPNYLYISPVPESGLDKVEAELGIRLPHSYRAFMKRFGPGEIQGWVSLRPIVPSRKGLEGTITKRTIQLRGLFPQQTEWFSNYQWLSSLIYFASNFCGDEYAWDPSDITRPRSHESRIYLLRRHDEENPVAVGDSFWQFVAWLEEDVRSFREPAELEENGSGLYFTPLYHRKKKRPLLHDVKRWLAWNKGTILNLATVIRSGNQKDMFPILADALEEAGCTNEDFIASCRCDTPEIDGIWVLDVLLGKE
jgi:SMI1 / KNR4 family (SUKH-1)